MREREIEGDVGMSGASGSMHNLCKCVCFTWMALSSPTPSPCSRRSRSHAMLRRASPKHASKRLRNYVLPFPQWEVGSSNAGRESVFGVSRGERADCVDGLARPTLPEPHVGFRISAARLGSGGLDLHVMLDSATELRDGRPVHCLVCVGPKVAADWPVHGQLWPNVVDVGLKSIGTGPDVFHAGPRLADADRCYPQSDRVRPTSAQLWPAPGQHRPHSVQQRPSLATCGQVRVKLHQV